MADFARVVTIGVAPLAVDGVASPAIAGVASPAFAGVESPAFAVMVPAGRMLLVVGLSSPEFGPVTWSAGAMFTLKPTATEVGDQPSSIGPDRLGDSTNKTESYRTAFGADFGNLFTGETYTPNDTGDADRPLSSDSVQPVETETEIETTSHAHWYRMIPKLEIYCSRPIPITREKLNYTGPSSV